MEMCGVCSLVFFVIMGAAKVGCRSSCTRSKSQADNRELPEQNLQHEENLNFLSQDNIDKLSSESYCKSLETYAAFSGVPKQLPRMVSSLVVFGAGR